MKKNQGFSLVELIVVIAIMAVLVGVLAPAYLRYVEKSRKSSDVSSVSDIVAAAEKVAIDVQYDLPAGTKFTVSCTTGDIKLNVQAGSTTAYEDALKEWIAISNGTENGTSSTVVYKCKSKEFQKSTANASIVGTIQDAGSVNWTGTVATTNVFGYSNDFVTKFGLTRS